MTLMNIRIKAEHGAGVCKIRNPTCFFTKAEQKKKFQLTLISMSVSHHIKASLNVGD